MTQYIFAIGASDITDVIDNTLGAVIGILLYLGMKKIWKEKTGKIITILGAVLEVLFLALLLFYVCGEWDVLRLEFRKG